VGSGIQYGDSSLRHITGRPVQGPQGDIILHNKQPNLPPVPTTKQQMARVKHTPHKSTCSKALYEQLATKAAHSGMTLGEVRHLTELPLHQLVREIALGFDTSLEFDSFVIVVLQKASEAYLADLFV
jgi:hypothetical protein